MRRRLRPRHARATIAHLCAWAACAALGRGTLAADLYYLGAQYTPGAGYPAPWPTQGSWFDTNLWQGNVLPTSTTNAIFGSDQTMPNDNTIHAPHTLHFGNFGYCGDTVIAGGIASGGGTVTILSDNWVFDASSGQNPDFTGTVTPSTGTLYTGSLSLAPANGSSASLTLANGYVTARTCTLASQVGSQVFLTLGPGSSLGGTNGTFGISGSANITQAGGQLGYGSLLSLGYNSGATCIYNLEAGTLSLGLAEYIGWYGSGTFIQNGGTHVLPKSMGYLGLGFYDNAVGVYTLNDGQLTTNREELGVYGSGTFIQNGGTHTVANSLTLPRTETTSSYLLNNGVLNVLSCAVGSCVFTQIGGTYTVSSMGVGGSAGGSYLLSNGQLTVQQGLSIAGRNFGCFEQTGGTCTISGYLVIGAESPARGTYTLTNGTLSVNSETVGQLGTGSLIQTGGSHAVGTLYIGPGSSFRATGGTLQIANGLANEGTLLLGGTTTLSFGGLLDLGQATFQDIGQTSFTLAADSILILPAGMDTAQFAHFTNDGGTIMYSGSPLNIPAGTLVQVGGGSCHEFVYCAGTLSGSAMLFGGLQVQGAAASVTVDRLSVDDQNSGLTDGHLTVNNRVTVVGRSRNGSFVQDGGTVTLGTSGGTLSLGVNDGVMGSYFLNGSLLKVSNTFVGESGTGIFVQNQGTFTATTSVFLGLNSGSSGYYTLNNGRLSSSSAEIGYSGAGVFVQTSGSMSVGVLCLGHNAGAVGSFTLSNGQLNVGDEYVGYSGTGSFTQSTSTQTISGTLCLGYNTGAVANYAFNDGILNITSQNAYIGYSGTGTFSQTSGTQTINYGLYLGYAAPSKGCYNLSKGRLVITTSLFLGYNGIGSFTQTGGTLSAIGNRYAYSGMCIGYSAGSIGNYSLSDGQFTTPFEIVGQYGNGNVVQTGGTHTVQGDLWLGWYPGSQGKVELSGGTLSVDVSFYLGLSSNSKGTFIQTNGLLLGNPSWTEWRIGGINSAEDASAVGVYCLSGGTLSVTPNFQVGAYGIGTFTQSGGTATFYGWTSIGRFAGGIGHMVVSAGTLTHGSVSSHLIVGEQGSGDLTISGTGVVQLASTLSMNYSGLATGAVYLNGGTLVCPGVSVLASKAYFNFNGGTLKANASSTTFLQGLASAKIQAGGAMIDTAGYTITIAQPLIEDSASRGGSLVKLGAGTLTLTGTGSHFDGLQVAAGNLSLQSAFKINSTSAPRGTLAVALDIAAGGLTFGTSGSLDITNHDMLLRYSSGTATTALSTALSWLQSSKLKSTSLTANQALACVNNAALATPFTGFDGIALADSNQILIKYTWKGDANLDGKINFNDYLALDAGYLFGGTDWPHGDFTGDNQVTVADYVAIDAAALAQNQVLASDMIALHTQQFGDAYTEALAAAIPEPATLSLLAGGALILLRRRK